MSRLRLLYQIVFAIVGIVFATSVILTFYSLSVQQDLIRSQLNRKGHVLSEVLSLAVMNHLLSYDFYTIKLLFDPVQDDPDVMSVSLIGADNLIKMDSDLTRLGESSGYELDLFSATGVPAMRREAQTGGLAHYTFLAPVEIDHNRIGLIEVVLSDAASVRLIEESARQMLALTGAVLVFAFVAAYLMSRQISRPVIELTERMQSFPMRSDQRRPEGKQTNEIVILEETFNSMMEQIEEAIAVRVRTEKMAVLGHLNLMLAHEVRNPLEPIKGSAELLRISYPGDEQIAKYTDIIQSEVSELIAFLDSFLEMARSNEPKMVPVPVNEVIREVVDLIEYAARKERISIDLDLDPGLPTVPGDTTMIKHVLLNTFLNAIQAKSGPQGRIIVESSYSEEQIHVMITDDGKGIPAAILEDIFQPFYTTRKDGSGVGLSTSRRIIEMHRGEIGITSEEGAWTTVTISLPRRGE